MQPAACDSQLLGGVFSHAAFATLGPLAPLGAPFAIGNGPTI